MIEDPEHQPAVEQAISSALGEPHRMQCVLMSELPAESPATRDRRRAGSSERSARATGPDSGSEAEQESTTIAEEEPDPVVREAVDSYGARVVKVTQRRGGD
jgi:hypothetical protein